MYRATFNFPYLPPRQLRIFNNEDFINSQVPAVPREVSEVTAQMKETLVTPTSSSTSSSSSASMKKGYQLEQDIGTMLYSGEWRDTQYPVLAVTLLTSATPTHTRKLGFTDKKFNSNTVFIKHRHQHFVQKISSQSFIHKLFY